MAGTATEGRAQPMAQGEPPDHGRAADWLVELAQRHRLSPTQRQLVQRMLGMFPNVAFLSTVEIAERAGVSQPTVARLAAALGFAGFPEFRAALRQVVLASPPAERTAPDPHDAGVLAIEQERANLTSLRWVIDSDRMGEA